MGGMAKPIETRFYPKRKIEEAAATQNKQVLIR